MDQMVVRDGETGLPIVSGANVPVDAILERLAVTGSVERVLEVFPSLTREGFDAAMQHAAIAVRRPVLYDTPGVGPLEVRETAMAYGEYVDAEEAAEEVEEAFLQARHNYELAAALHRGFGDLMAGRVMPHADFMAELHAMIQA